MYITFSHLHVSSSEEAAEEVTNAVLGFPRQI
jgi:hypothetical protein